MNFTIVVTMLTLVIVLHVKMAILPKCNFFKNNILVKINK